MGVPYFYSWLVKRYPYCMGNLEKIIFDNVYLDMNQIIYRCSTDPKVLFKDLIYEKQFDDVFLIIFNYLSWIID